MQVIKDVVKEKIQSVDDAGVVGQEFEGGPEKTIHSKKFVVKHPVRVEVGEDGNVSSDVMFGKLHDVVADGSQK